MNRYLLCLFLSLTVFCNKSFAQAPQLNSYTDTVSDYFINLYINYTSNDTGTIRAQMQLAQGSGNITFDSIYILPASGTTAVLSAGPLYYCASYSSCFLNLSNSHAFGTIADLFSFSTLCDPNSVAEVKESTYYLTMDGNSIQIHATEILAASVAEVFDLAGRKITTVNLTQSAQQVNINASSGLYLLRITAKGESVYTNKFVIN
ncbi:MAG: hypothetical protein JWO06_2714 [Bacteroidota bacterium]|nr:hypothetical protein [Bacteroidota bacterium]